MRGVSALDFAMGDKNKKASTNGWGGFLYGDKLVESLMIIKLTFFQDDHTGIVFLVILFFN